jgi:hypothetical protein
MSILRHVGLWPSNIIGKNKDFITQLIFANIEDIDERERYLSELESTSEEDEDELIKMLLKRYA